MLEDGPFKIDDWPKMIDDLKPIAKKLLRRNERRDHTLQTTALVHETLIKMMGPGWKGRAWEAPGAFFAEFVKKARRVLVDYARRRLAQRRGGHLKKVPLDDVVAMARDAPAQFIRVDALLSEMAAQEKVSNSERCAQVLVYRFYLGLHAAEIGEALGVSRETVQRDLKMGRAWIRQQVDGLE